MKKVDKFYLSTFVAPNSQSITRFDCDASSVSTTWRSGMFMNSIRSNWPSLD